MGKRKLKAKRSLSSTPKGLAVRSSDELNPFEVASRQKRPKHEVHNRKLANRNVAKKPSALASAVLNRQKALKASLLNSRKTNVFQDRRIGEYNQQMTAEEQNLQRLVKERSRQSKRSTKFNLDGDEEEVTLTHRGRSIDKLSARDHVILSDDEDAGDLDAADTSMHFGGGGGSGAVEDGYYGAGKRANEISSMYSSRKTELDELILRRKMQKAEKIKTREDQVDAFEAMDDSFAELSKMLDFREKEKEIRKHIQLKREGKLAPDDQEFEDWDKEMKTYQFLERKVKATDRTKTAEEIAKEESERLNELETRRLARMNGDFDDDDLSDISDDENAKRRRVRVSSEAAGGEKHDDDTFLSVGAKVTACYHANEQFDEEKEWYQGEVAAVNKSDSGGPPTYDIQYDDGDFEHNVKAEHVKIVEKTQEEIEEDTKKTVETGLERRKRTKAKEKARTEIPFVFEVPTTLEALHDMIATHASTGEDACLIIKRIHASNSVRLDRRNAEKMQNFYDVVMRRFVAVGDAIFALGDGGKDLGRYKQLDELTKVLYEMSQDSPEMASTVWGRRLGIFQNAHAKRLRDAEFEQEEEFSAWPSTGVLHSLRLLGHIFPVTDMRHQVVTPALLFLGQIITQTPFFHHSDLASGLFCCSLLIEYTREAKRVAPEALCFLADMIRLYSSDGASTDQASYMLPNFAAAAADKSFLSLRKVMSAGKPTDKEISQLVIEKDQMKKTSASAAALLFSVLHLLDISLHSLSSDLNGSEKELLAVVAERVLDLRPRSKQNPLPALLLEKLHTVATSLSNVCEFDQPREPLRLHRTKSKLDKMIKTLAPRMENPEKYSLSRDKGKSSMQAALDRTRREYRREHKAVSRELRIDSAFVERARREDTAQKDQAARTKRQKAFAWLEGEQAAMNQQVRLGGGLLKGGGMGAAKAKAASGVGMKKGKLKK